MNRLFVFIANAALVVFAVFAIAALCEVYGFMPTILAMISVTVAQIVAVLSISNKYDRMYHTEQDLNLTKEN